MKIKKRSAITDIRHTREIDITQEQLEDWNNTPVMRRKFIQNEFPALSADDREFLLTGTTPEEWAEIFPEGEEDE